MENAVRLRDVGIFALAMFTIPLFVSAVISFTWGRFYEPDPVLDLETLSLIAATAISFSLFVAVGLLSPERPYATAFLAFLLAETSAATLLLIIAGTDHVLGSLLSTFFHIAILPAGVVIGIEIRTRTCRRSRCTRLAPGEHGSHDGVSHQLDD